MGQRYLLPHNLWTREKLFQWLAWKRHHVVDTIYNKPTEYPNHSNNYYWYELVSSDALNNSSKGEKCWVLGESFMDEFCWLEKHKCTRASKSVAFTSIKALSENITKAKMHHLKCKFIHLSSSFQLIPSMNFIIMHNITFKLLKLVLGIRDRVECKNSTFINAYS